MKYIGLDVLGADNLPSGWVEPDWKKGRPSHKMFTGEIITDNEFQRRLNDDKLLYTDASYDETDLRSRGVYTSTQRKTTPSDPLASTIETTDNQYRLQRDRLKRKQKLAAATGAGAHCGAVAASWQSAVALLLILLLLVFLVQLMVTMINRGRQ